MALLTKKNIARLLTNTTLVLAAFCLALLLTELFLRNWKPHDQFYSLTPGLDIQGEFAAASYFPGLRKNFNFSTNEYGYRSENLFQKDRFGILALGGSTMECTFVGDEALWTNLLESKLNGLSQRPVTVGNVGVAALDSKHHLLQLEYLMPDLEGVEAVMMLVGVNDFLRALYQIDDLTDSAAHAKRAFTRYPRSMSSSWYKKTELWMHLRDIKNDIIKRNTGDEFPDSKEFERRREAFRVNRVVETLPDLSVGLQRYEQTIKSIFQYCQANSLKLILITQPLLWHEGMEDHEWTLASIGAYVAGDSTLSPGAYHQGIELYNNVLRNYATEESVTLVDLATLLPKDTTAFYDYCHFNIPGSHQVAEIVYENIQHIIAHE